MRALTSREAVLVVTSVFVAGLIFLMADFFVLSPLIPDKSKFHIYERFDHGWYTLRPNLDDAPYGWGKNFFSVSTDKNGFRVERKGAADRPAEFIFLGDSYTFGITGPWNETFVGMFAKNSGRSVINAGVGSYSPSAYLYQYKMALSAGRLAPGHKVIVALDISDVQDEGAAREDGPDHPVQSARRAALPSDERPPLQEFLSSNFLATRAIFRRIRGGANSPPEETDGPPPLDVFDQTRSAFTWKDWRSLEPGSPDSNNPDEQLGYGPNGVRRGLDKIRASMVSLSTLAEANRGEIWLFIYPWPAQLKYESRVFDWEKFAADLCQEMSCRGVIDTFPAFRSLAANHADWYKDLYVFGDSHFNKFGNEILATQLLLRWSSRAQLNPTKFFARRARLFDAFGGTSKRNGRRFPAQCWRVRKNLTFSVRHRVSPF